MGLQDWLRMEQTASLWGWRHWLSENRKLVPSVDRYGRKYNWISKKDDFWRGTIALDIAPAPVYEQKPLGFNRGEMPTQPAWKQNRYLLPRSLLPIAIQALSYHFFPNLRWHWSWALVYYFAAYGFHAFAILRYLHYYMGLWGCLDEENRPRQLVSDDKALRVGLSLWVYALGRSTLMTLYAWDSDESPRLNLWSYPRICLWLIVLDYYFYVVHRSYHQVDFLWGTHALHHSVRHPTAALAILADDIQEFGDIWLLPMLTCLTVPLRFHELYIANTYLLSVEGAGHAGIRAHWGHPLLDWFLRPFDMELEIEDHDLHHRHGRGGMNYGKQTRIFDRIFGTVGTRVEGKKVTPDDLTDVTKDLKAPGVGGGSGKTLD